MYYIITSLVFAPRRPLACEISDRYIQSQRYRVFMHLDIHREKGSHLEFVNTRIFRRIYCNLKTIVNSLPPYRGFFQFGFPHKIFLSPSVYFAEIFNYYRKIEKLIRLWCEVDCPINCVRKSPPHSHNTFKF